MIWHHQIFTCDLWRLSERPEVCQFFCDGVDQKMHAWVLLQWIYKLAKPMREGCCERWWIYRKIIKLEISYYIYSSVVFCIMLMQNFSNFWQVVLKLISNGQDFWITPRIIIIVIKLYFKRLVSVSDKREPSFLRQRISICIQRFNSVCLKGTFNSIPVLLPNNASLGLISQF